MESLPLSEAHAESTFDVSKDEALNFLAQTWHDLSSTTFDTQDQLIGELTILHEGPRWSHFHRALIRLALEIDGPNQHDLLLAFAAERTRDCTIETASTLMEVHAYNYQFIRNRYHATTASSVTASLTERLKSMERVLNP
ncbi:MAG: hypothetical protein NVS1B7_1110 [Candidatus Saccharimonadales bacterium]